MQVTLNFHEDLRNLFPEKLVVEAATPLSALQLVSEQHPLVSQIDPVPVRFLEISSLGEMERNYFEDIELTVVPAQIEAILLPNYAGSGNSSQWLSVIVGVVLVIAAAPWGLALFGKGMMAQTMMSLGVSMALTGILQILAPSPEKPDNRKSAYFSGTASTVSSDTPIALAFGRRRLYGHYLSVNIDARNFDGDLSKDSAWFSGKVDDSLPTIRLRNFYGLIKAGNETIVHQVDNAVDRTGGQV